MKRLGCVCVVFALGLWGCHDSGAGPGEDASVPDARDGDPGGDPVGPDIDNLPCDPSVPLSVDVLDQTEMLIVTGPSLAPAFEALADWKRAKGVPCEVVTTDLIDQNMAGVDGAERVREYIRSLHANGDLAYVLLGGDAEVVPYRNLHTQALFTYDAEFASDFYFSDLDGTFDANGNGTYGEIDDDVEMHPDVSVARLPVSTPAETARIIDRLLAYEQTDSGHATDALFISEDSGFMGFDSAIQLDPLANNTFPAGYAKQKLYWKHESYPDAEPNSLQAQLDAIDAGKNFVTHYGHSSEHSLNMEMSGMDVDELTNAPVFPVYVSCGCLAGDFAFDTDCAGERLLTNPNGGAVAYLGNTNIGLGPTGGTALIKSFYEALFAGNDRLGDALSVARNSFYTSETSLHNETTGIRWTQFVVVLFGDPEMPVRTAVPEQLTLEHPGVLGRGEQCLEVRASLDGQPLAGIQVAIFRPGKFLYRQETDAAGTTVFRFTPQTPGQIMVTATLAQSLPALSTITVP